MREARESWKKAENAWSLGMLTERLKMFEAEK